MRPQTFFRCCLRYRSVDVSTCCLVRWLCCSLTGAYSQACMILLFTCYLRWWYNLCICCSMHTSCLFQFRCRLLPLNSPRYLTNYSTINVQVTSPRSSLATSTPHLYRCDYNTCRALFGLFIDSSSLARSDVSCIMSSVVSIRNILSAVVLLLGYS